jgi:hypothetical protein
MNVLFATVLALAGVGGGPAKAIEHAQADAITYEDCYDCVGGRHGHGGHLHSCWGGPMPQTCYDPAYGCYPGTRFMNRYPAFHANYYRRPYHYRHVFDYPWHADLHEPTSLYSYHVTGEGGEPVPPQPVAEPPAAARLPLHERLEAAIPAPRQPQPLRTLRR